MIQIRSSSKGASKAIVDITGNELKAGSLARLFQDGAKAIVLREDDRVKRIWDGLLNTQNGQSVTAHQLLHPWEISLIDNARNHQAGNITTGDMLRFIRGSIAHTARKFIIYPDKDGQPIKTDPECFWNGNQFVALPEEIGQTAWELMSDILNAVDTDSRHPYYAAEVDLLKYPNSWLELNQLCDLLQDFGGGWTKLGYKIDCYKQIIHDRLGIQINHVNNLLALCSLIPGVRPITHRLDWLQFGFQMRDIPEGFRIIGSAHTDGSKVLNALASDRDILRTEIYDGRHWVELQLNLNSLAIFPSNKINRDLGIEPTVHRLLMKNQNTNQVPARPNITLSLGITDHPEHR